MSGARNGSSRQKTVVVIGNGMVGQRFCEKLVEYDMLAPIRYRHIL